MARILITGSSDGLGQRTARFLVAEGHKVVLHARNEERAQHAMAQVPGAEQVLWADLSSIAQTRYLAEEINAMGTFDAIVHNAALGFRESERNATPDGLPEVFAVNSLAPYILTALVKRPKRLVYISSRLHMSGDRSLSDLAWESRRWNGYQAYADSKLHIVLLAFAVARHWPEVLSNCVEPGWVATKLGGPTAAGDLDLASRTQAWLAAGIAAATRVTGDYFYHQKSAEVISAAFHSPLQERYLQACALLSGVQLPER